VEEINAVPLEIRDVSLGTAPGEIVHHGNFVAVGAQVKGQM
jgi:hypothetical protein